ncbi:hypothetical protein BH09DEP1_BH09DEP1_1110 [soil metagenome]
MKQLVLLLLITFSLKTHSCQIVEHNHFGRILDFILPSDFHNNTLIVLAIANTIAQPEKLIGSEEWVAYIMNTYGDTSISDIKARFQSIAPLYFEVMHTVNFIPIEPITATIIRELQNSGVIVIGLTARSFEVAERTIEQLYNIGIDLSLASLWHEELWHDCHLSYCHMNGVVFCDGNDKGKVLCQVLERINYCPTKIIAVDDKERHLNAIAKAVCPCIEFVGIRYSYLDAKVKNFDTVAADEQLLEWIMWQWLFEGY